MRNSVAVPTTLAGAIKYFANKDVAHEFLASLRWPEGPYCPRCACTEYSYLKTRRLYKCKGCEKQYSVKLGTIFEDSPIGLDKWLPAVWLIVNAKNGISSYELHRALGVTQKTAWFMLHRIRLAMQTKTFAKVSGDVEVDETYIGRSRVKRDEAKRFVETHVEVGANLFTDEHKSYVQMRKNYIHGVIDHGVRYAKGKVHINGMENFWSLLKRGIRGTYVSVEPFHLFRYLDEQVFRFNTRKTKDVARFVMALGQFVNKRLTYAELIGENVAPATT
jgi:transposase-like protein